MRALIAACAVAACVGSAALAQTDAMPELQYELMPTGQDYGRTYPQRAIDAGQEGVAVLCCTVRDDRTLACESRFDAPADWGFAEASLLIVQRFRLTSESYAEYQASSRAGVPFRRVITWQMDGVSPRWQRYMELVREQTANICQPDGAPVDITQ